MATLIDLSDKIHVYLITNGRSTFPYVLKSLESQSGVNFNFDIIKDMNWLEANRKILSECPAPFMVRLDDDMILHEKAVAFMWHCVNNLSKDIVLRGWRLWEPYSNKICKGVKAYHTQRARKIGFRPNDLGKIDKPFKADANEHRLKIDYSDDVIAIHCCSTFEEHHRYNLMRGEDKGKNFKKDTEWLKNSINNCSLTLDEQSKLSGKFLNNHNKKKKTKFFKFING